MGKMIIRALLVAALFAAPACEDDHEHTDRPTCDELAEVCHESTTEAGMACHELGHDEASTEAECMAQHDACEAECAPE